MQAPSRAFPTNRAGRAILIAGLLAGLGDITQAFVVFGFLSGTTPKRIFQSVAVGALGPDSFSLGWKSAVLGCVLHFTIALIWAAVFYLASGKLAALITHPIISGLLYGLVVFLFMYEVVLPLSRVARDPRASLFTVPLIITGWIGHPLLVGLPIAWAVRRSRR